ncbi:LysE family translocator [Saccharomonospora sp. CUA-673]|uniref:LysE family translocator n=1 Tax=Saccharomonospora sp. CUA-673 TaxID=1904969 RepID=UPI0009FABBCA|nr:LysE family transporter [Saccharomonospora sp. CUA-673]
MEQFAAVAAAHFLALLIPGVDFVLIARTALVTGRRRAVAVCLGIAGANGILIAAAFSGVALLSHPVLLGAVQAAGGAFLVFVGVVFVRSKVRIDLGDGARAGAAAADGRVWWRAVGLGLASGLLNPKNALFYVSLAAAVAAAPAPALVAYGAWMVTVVLAWDVFVAVVLGSRRALARMDRALPWLTAIAGGFLVLFAPECSPTSPPSSYGEHRLASRTRYSPPRPITGEGCRVQSPSRTAARIAGPSMPDGPRRGRASMR